MGRVTDSSGRVSGFENLHGIDTSARVRSGENLFGAGHSLP
jgi:hypothetical protein